ncbi:glycosyltransferase [Burkholderiaceae bacterium]|nr:glycosyltransferase [Burkholderiaceae bacterium]
MTTQSNLVMHVITSLATGGAEVMLWKLIRSNDNKKFPSVVISLTDLGTLGQSIMDSGVPVHTLGMKRGKISFSSLLTLASLIKHTKPAIVLGWMYHGNIAALCARTLARSSARLVWNVRHTPYDLGSEKVLTSMLIRLSAPLSRYPDRVIYNSHVSLQRHCELGFNKRNSIMIPNGFDLQEFSASAEKRMRVMRELRIPDDAPVVGHIARFHPMKDHQGFLQSARLISQKFPDARFVLAGRDVSPANTQLVEWCKASGLKDKVFLLGERADVSDLLSAIDILCLSSAWGEGFPNIIGEAMACGVPCVTTDVGDAGFIVGNIGQMVPKRDPVALAEASCAILSATPSERRVLGVAARQRIADNFSLIKVANTYQSVYMDVLGIQKEKLTLVSASD